MPQSIEERFWAKVDTSGDCWIWTGAAQKKGYGRFRIDGRLDVASRVAYRLSFGPIPDGYHVCHRCDNPPCVRPEHLFLGTRSENMWDASKKGRLQGRPATAGSFKPGVSHRSAKLTPDQVAEIRRRYAAGEVLQRDLAAEFGLSQPQISKIVRGAMWATG